MESLVEELKIKIIELLNLVDVDPDRIEGEDPLFGDGLGLDSIDALELIVMLEKDYQIKIDKPEDGKAIFATLNTLATFIKQQQKA